MLKWLLCNGVTFLCLVLISAVTMGQQRNDSIPPVQKKPVPSATKKTDTTASKMAVTDTAKTKKKKSESSKAALRSAILPGWGQAYNKKYWKMPIVYAALAVPIYTFTYNKKWYDKTREAYSIKYHNDTVTVSPPLSEEGIDDRLKPLSAESLRLYRNQFRQGMDLSILALLIVWGLQVADAAVDAHLKGFNINDDLSLKIKPWYSPAGKANGISLILTPRDGKVKQVIPAF